jgi:hypothetical protein
MFLLLYIPWSIVRKWGEWRDGVYLIPVFPFLIRLKATEELFSKGSGGIMEMPYLLQYIHGCQTHIIF